LFPVQKRLEELSPVEDRGQTDRVDTSNTVTDFGRATPHASSRWRAADDMTV